MCCFLESEKSCNCSCQTGMAYSPMFWSKGRKISFLEEHLKCLESQVDEVKQVLKEFKE